MTTPTTMTEEPIEEVERRLAAFTSHFVDHGLQWERRAAKETAELSGHILMVLPAMEPTPDEPFSFCVIRSVEGRREVVARGRAATRSACRQGAVLALADLASPTAPITVESVAPAHSKRQRLAATIILLAMLVLFIGATVVGVMR